MNLKDILTELQETIQPFWDQAMAAYFNSRISVNIVFYSNDVQTFSAPLFRQRVI